MMRPYKILVPVDFSEHSRKALDEAAFLAQRLDGELRLLYVWQPPLYTSPEITLSMIDGGGLSLEKHVRGEVEKDFETFLRGFAARGLVTSQQIEVGRPAAGILKAAQEGIDLIVIGTHGRTGLGRLFMGSVAQEVVAKATCPVVTVNAGAQP